MGEHALRLALLLAAICTLGLPSAASAAFPGTNGRIVFVSDRDGQRRDLHVESGRQRPAAPDRDLARRPTRPTRRTATKIAFARSSDIWVMNADGSGQVAITGTEGPTASRRGRRTARRSSTSATSTSGGGTTGPELFVMNADGPARAPGDDTPTGASRAPAWSPAGDQIAYQSNADGGFEIYTIDAGATASFGTRRSPNEIGQNYQNPSWSPDGARIAFERGNGTNVGDTTKEIWTMRADGTEPCSSRPTPSTTPAGLLAGRHADRLRDRN